MTVKKDPEAIFGNPLHKLDFARKDRRFTGLARYDETVTPISAIEAKNSFTSARAES